MVSPGISAHGLGPSINVANAERKGSAATIIRAANVGAFVHRKNSRFASRAEAAMKKNACGFEISRYIYPIRRMIRAFVAPVTALNRANGIIPMSIPNPWHIVRAVKIEEMNAAFKTTRFFIMSNSAFSLKAPPAIKHVPCAVPEQR